MAETSAQRTAAIEAAKTTPCRWCGFIHGLQCPSVKAIEYYPDGTTTKRVEFHAPVQRITGGGIGVCVGPGSGGLPGPFPRE